MAQSPYQKATFLLSVAHLHQLPADQGIEIAIVGRSNAGKSTALNQLTQNSRLARVSKTPGRTQHINLFALDEMRRIADLPGYGYAKVPPAIKHHWQVLIDNYLRKRHSLAGLILVMDCRHPLKDFDQQLLLWSCQCQLPVHILLNKIDKLSQQAIKQVTIVITEHIKAYQNPVSFQLFSALKGKGLKELRDVLDKWFAY